MNKFLTIILIPIFMALILCTTGCQGLNKKETKLIKRHSNLCYREYEMQRNNYDKDYQEAIEARYNQVNKLFAEVLGDE